MRWLFYLLLAANALLLGWGMRQLEPQAAVPPAPVLTSTVNRLLLLSELENGALRQRRGEPPAQATQAANEEAAERATVAEAGKASAAEGGESPMTLEEAVDAATRPYSDSSLPARRTDALCYSVGPLESDEEVSGMREWLERRGGKLRLREDERREVVLYWVHLPPMADRADANALVERLRADGVDDIFIIPGGDQRNAISLGVYSRSTSLERRLRELRGHGYDPSVSNRYRTSVAAWFDVELPADFRFDPGPFGARFPSAQLEPVDCESIARADTPADG